MLKHSRPFGLLALGILAAAAICAQAGPDTGAPPRPRPEDKCRPNSSAQSPCCRRNPSSPGCWDRAAGTYALRP